MSNEVNRYDLICVGGGIMSTTLALLAKLIDPTLSIAIFERLNDVALESSSAWNNAGTGHSALCELNYTPENGNGEIEIKKALEIFEQFETSKQFWVYLKQQGFIDDVSGFINSVPHHSWVVGTDNADFLEKRYQALSKHPFFAEMKFTRSHETMKEWFPLIMKDRVARETLAATRMVSGAEMNFGALTHHYKEILQTEFDVEFYFEHEVKDIDPTEDVDWLVEVKDRSKRKKYYYDAPNVFIGAGGWALPLLQKVEIPEKHGYGGFPVSGQWLICNNEEIVNQHFAKVYTKAGPDAPPMSTPHLDTRYINGKRELLFGPFAGFSTKFLKKGTYFDLPKSIKIDNINPMFGAFWKNLELTEYLIHQVSMDHEDRMDDLRKFIVEADADDWELKIAGQRVQVIKKDIEQGGVLEFGTEVVKSKDGNITALLGASPGASVSVYVILEVLQTAFPERIKTEQWQQKLKEIFPFYGRNPLDFMQEYMQTRYANNELLGLQNS